MSDELKPCPFCGATDEVMTVRDFWAGFLAGAIPAEAEVANQVGCTVCDIWTPAFDTEEEAITAWNHRATTITHAVIVSDESTDCATGHCECELCKQPIDPWDRYCRHCGAEVVDDG